MELGDAQYVSEMLRSRTAHRRAAEAHERAALVDDRAAQRLQAQDRPDRAIELWRSAVEHRAAAAKERERAADYSL
jgi:hypothetical protein